MADFEESSNVENIDTEVVVIGGGGAGLAAAVAAAEKGSRVIVLEKRRTAGGSSALAVGLFAAESPDQKRQRIDAQKDECFKIAMDYAHWTINPRIVRAFIDKSGDTIRWLEEKGLRVERISPAYPNQRPLVWHIPEKWGAGLVEVLVKSCADWGVPLLYQTAAKKILTDGSGKVAGVLAVMSGKENKELRISAKTVIIATGGYAGNKEMLRQYCPAYDDDMFCRGVRTMGDGIAMATEVGAATEGLGILQLGGPHFRGPVKLWSAALNPEAIWVNKKGERFIDEAVGLLYFVSINALLRQPDRICYSLFDAEIKRDIMEEGLTTWATLVFEPEDTKLTEFERDFQTAVARGNARVADSWDEIAGWIGIAPDALRATIDEYNAGCDRGHDGIFAKERQYLRSLRTSPYYALKCSPAFLGTIGGIRINHHMEVVDTHDRAIPGLYAVGVDTGGWESETYCGVLSGSTLGFAISSGRIAGENAASHMLRK
jgi:fumarate reductase flavoprotein subunit